MRAAAPAAALAALGLFLLPARVTAMRGDDVFAFGLEGRLALTGESLAAFIWDGAVSSLADGRAQPLGSLWGNLVIAVFGDARAAYKLFIVAMTVVAAALLYALARRLGAGRGPAALAVLLVAGAVQFRAYHDPVLGYYATTQAALACVLASLLLMLRGRTGWAVAAFAGGVMLYEVVAPMALVHVGLAWSRGNPRQGLPFVACSALFVAYGFVVRTFLGGESGGGYTVGYDVPAILGTYLEQLLPPLPGANVLFGDGALFARPTAPELLGAAWRAAVVAAAVLAVGWRRPAMPLRPLAITGALMLATPVLLIAMAEKYQRELSPATGYLPVIAQTFGWALLATAAVVLAARRRAALLAVAALLGAGAGLSGYDVLRVAATEVPRARLSDALVQAAGRGALRALPEGSTVILVEADLGAGTTGWGEKHMLDAALRERTGRRYDGRHHPAAGIGTCEADPAAEIPRDCGPLTARAAWLRLGTRPEQTAVTVAEFAGPAFGSPTRRLTAYVEGDDLAPPPLSATAGDGSPWDPNRQPWRRIGGGGRWALYEIVPFAPAPVADSIAHTARALDPAATIAAPDLVRRLGTARVLP